MQLQTPIPFRIVAGEILTSACLVVVAWSLGTWLGSEHPLPIAGVAHEASADATQVETIRDHISPADQQLTPANTPPSSVEKPKRGIRPPWRENAIPELRKQPGQKPRMATT